jgi:alanyl-tRNA synthetase
VSSDGVGTKPLYYDSPITLEFDATVLTVERSENHLAVVLDQTAFYPEGGGQPADRGEIAGLSVTEVSKGENGIVHLLESPERKHGDTDERMSRLSPGSSVHGRVDETHRREYMQQHSGQHVLSGAFIAVGGYETVSVHQGSDYTTIELNAPEIPEAQLREIEQRANDVIEADLPITAQTVHESEIHTVPLRRPPKVSGDIRVVQVGDFDCVACGGVHCTRTGEIRLIRLHSVETIRGNVRTAWKIGDRALEHYRETSTIVSDLVSELSAKPEEVVPRVRQIGERLRELEAEVRNHKIQEYARIAREIATNASGRDSVITEEFTDRSSEFLRSVTELLVEEHGATVCLINRSDNRLYWSVGVAPGSDLPFGDHKNDLLAHIGGKGGGRPPIWQGVGDASADTSAFFAAFRRIAVKG